MIDALISGRIHRKPQQRRTGAGKPFATCTLRAATRDGAVIFVNVIAFEAQAVAAILALEDGDSIAIAGELTPKVYAPDGAEPRPTLDLLAHAVLTEYHVTRKRKTVQEQRAEQPPFDDAF